MTGTALYKTDERVLVEDEKYVVREMLLTPQKVVFLWEHVRSHRTLFSDLTRDNFPNFLRYLVEGYSMWMEILIGDELIGIACFTHLERVIDTDVHMLFFDRDLADKANIGKKIVKWMFANFPLQRMTVETPRFYYATIRLAKEIGFKWEGEKVRAALISGRWSSLFILGLTRLEADKL